jgi:Tfp pilus assembly PilM family ATPase
MPSYVIGLDVGSGSVKAAVLKGTLRGYEIEDFLSLDIAEAVVSAEDTQPMPVMSPAGEGHADEEGDDEDVDSPVGEDAEDGDADADAEDEEALPAVPDPSVTAAVRAVRRARSDAVRTILDTIGQPTAVVVASVPADKASTWIIDLPFSDVKRIEQTIDFEVENYVPWDLDDVILDYEVLGPVNDGSRVLTAMVPRDTVAAELLTLADAGLDPKHLCIDALELARLVPLTDDVVAVIDVGSERTLVCVAQDGVARWVRSMDGGADEFPEAQFEPDSLELPEPPAPVDWIRAIRGTLLAAEESGAPEIDAVMLCGGGSRQDGLAEELAESLGVPVGKLEMPAAAVNPEDAPVPEPEHALAYALALRGFARKRKDGVVLDFRQGEFAWKADSKVYARLAAGAVAAIVLLGLGFVGNHFLELKKLSDQLDSSTSQMVATVQGVFPDVPDTSLMTPEQTVAVMQEKVLAINERVAALKGYEITPLAALKEISEAVPKSVVVDVDEFMINDEMVRIRGTTDSYGSVDTIEAQIKSNPMFAQAEKSDVNKDREGKARFVVRAPRQPVDEEDEG